MWREHTVPPLYLDYLLKHEQKKNVKNDDENLRGVKTQETRTDQRRVKGDRRPPPYESHGKPLSIVTTTQTQRIVRRL